jgi:hypothetical protein
LGDSANNAVRLAKSHVLLRRLREKVGELIA